MAVRPNVLLIMADQQRGDCLGVENHPCLMTPSLDAIAHTGTRFRRAYSSCPLCIPARRSLMTGTFPSTHGVVGYAKDQELVGLTTLPQAFSAAGYHTAMVGWSMDLYPPRKRFGFDEMTISEDYLRFLEENMPEGAGGHFGSGVMINDWTAHPWHLEDNLHTTNWTANRALDFLRRRDPSCPYFLTVSFLAPHPPLHPPAFYFERYLRTGVPDPVLGEWAQPPPGGMTALEPDAANVNLRGEALLSTRAAYYGLINHLDDQIRRILNRDTGIGRERETIVVFVSDHGEMLGDHYFARKSQPYEGSVRVPFLVQLPSAWEAPRGQVVDAPVCLEDLMPTLLDLCDISVPSTVEGASLKPFLVGKPPPAFREFVPLEHSGGWHALTDGREKYIWHSRTGAEQFFDLVADPQERRDLAPSCEERVAPWRALLIERLANRPEGFAENGKLKPGHPHRAVIPYQA